MLKKVEVPVLGVDREHELLRLPELRPPRRDLPARRRPQAGRARGHPVPRRDPARARGQPRRRRRHAGRRSRDPDSKVAEIFLGIASDVACQLSVRNTPAPETGKRSSKLTLIR